MPLVLILQAKIVKIGNDEGRLVCYNYPISGKAGATEKAGFTCTLATGFP